MFLNQDGMHTITDYLKKEASIQRENFLKLVKCLAINSHWKCSSTVTKDKAASVDVFYIAMHHTQSMKCRRVRKITNVKLFFKMSYIYSNMKEETVMC